MIYTVRIARNERSFLEENIRKQNSVFYLGWGEFSLLEENFTAMTCEYYSRKPHIPNSLKKIRHFSDGDLLLVPNFPSNKLLTILEVNGNFPNNYTWNKGNPSHLNHGIHIKNCYGLEGNISMHHHLLVKWYGKSRGMQLPINNTTHIRSELQEIITTLKKNPEQPFSKSTIEDYLIAQSTSLLNQFKEQLYRLNPNNSDLSFEKIIENLIRQNGYELHSRNIYDKNGGDADLIFSKEHEATTPFEIGLSYLFVQVKKHRGTTDEKGVDQLIKIMDSKREFSPAKGCLITLADDCSEETYQMAEDAGIKIITGIELCRLLIDQAMVTSEAVAVESI